MAALAGCHSGTGRSADVRGILQPHRCIRPFLDSKTASLLSLIHI